MKYLLFIVFNFIICAFGLKSASVNFKGRIVETINANGVVGALVSDVNSSQFTFTDSQGYFSFHSQSASNIRVQINALGYEKRIANISAGKAEIIKIEKAIILLGAVVINGKMQMNPLANISTTDLSIRPIKSSQEVLQFVPGLFISQHQGGGKAEQIFIRGFDVDHGTDLAITVDGMPVNMVSHAHGQGYADLHFVIPELISNTEYGKGPFFANSGNFTTAGFVALKTRKNLERNTAQIEIGQFNTQRFLGMINIVSSLKRSSYFALEYVKSDGPFESPQNFKRLNLVGNYVVKLKAKTELRLIGSLFGSSWSASGQIPDRAVNQKLIGRFGAIDNTEGGKVSRLNGSAILHSQINQSSYVEQQLYYSKVNFLLFSNFTFFLKDSINGDQIKQAEARNIFGYHAKYKKNGNFAGFRTALETGLGVRHDRIMNSQLSHTKNKVDILERKKFGNIYETNSFVYSNYQVQWQNWIVAAGARADYFNFMYQNFLENSSLNKQQKTIISPKLDITYEANKSLQFYLKGGKGFHTNDTRVVVAEKDKNVLPAAYGCDLGFIKKYKNRLLLQSAFWIINMEQEFIYVGDEGITEIGEKTRRFGVDISARWDIGKGLFFFTDFTYCIPQSLGVPNAEKYIPLAPKFTNSGGIFYKNPRGYYIGFNYRKLSNRPASETNTIIAQGYTLFDANAGIKKGAYEIGIVVENLFNSEWKEAQFNTESRLKEENNAVTEIHFTPGTPFSARVKLILHF